MSIREHLEKFSVSPKKIDAIVNSCRIGIRMDIGEDLIEEHALKRYVDSRIFQLTQLDLTTQFKKKQEYEDFVKYHIYSSVDQKFVVSVFSEYVAQKLSKNEDVNLLSWRDYSESITGGKNIYFLSGSLDEIDIINKNTKGRIRDLEKKIKDLALEMKAASSRTLQPHEKAAISGQTKATPSGLYKKWAPFAKDRKTRDDFKQRANALEEEFKESFVFVKA